MVAILREKELNTPSGEGTQFIHPDGGWFDDVLLYQDSNTANCLFGRMFRRLKPTRLAPSWALVESLSLSSSVQV